MEKGVIIMSIINLKFKNTTVALAGNPYGRKVFNEQVKPYIHETDDSIIIALPSQISYVTSSFIQGFFDFWLRTIGYDEIKKKIIIQTDDERVKNYIWENLE